VLPQGALGIETTRPGRRHQLEELPAQYLRPKPLGVARHRRAVHHRLRGQLALFELLAYRLGKHQRGQPRRELLEDCPRPRRRTGLAFLGLDLLPLHQHLGRAADPSLPEDVGMTPHQLLVNVSRHIVEVEPTRLRLDLCMEDDLDQHIAQFLPHMLHIAAVDGVD
jgi:hypothetical protein